MTGMDKDRNQRSETILNLTLEIIYLLTGEDYVIVSKTSGENVMSSSLQLSGRWVRTQSSNMEPQSLIPERSNNLKILELTNKIIQLLTGEDRDYVEGLKDLVEGKQQPLVLSDCTSEGSRIEINIQATKDEGVIMDTDHPQIQCSYTAIKEESGDRGDLIISNIQTLANHARENILCNIKEEPASPKEEILTDTDIAAPTDYTQPQSTAIKVIAEEQRLRDTDNCSSSGRTDIKYTNIHIKEESDTGGVENVTDAEYSTPLLETQHSPSQIDQIHQTQEKPFLCPVCGKYFKCKSGFINHQKLHTGENMHSCSECGKTFITKSYLTKHQRLHTGEKPYSCVECGKCFFSNSYLVNHHKVHTGEKPYSCSECGKCFSTNSNLVKHKKFHIGDRPYFCTECGKSFVAKKNLVSHLQTHAEEKPFSCSECGKCFINKHYLIAHSRVHSGEKPYPCSECGKCFKTKSNLVKHQMLHTGEKPFTCGACRKSFVNNAKLVLHQKIHTRVKPFSCSECGICFTTQSFLVTHRKIHTGDKIYSCTECEKCYTNSSALVRHLRTHTGEKPYCCDECGKRFAQKTHLLRHQKIHSR